MYNTLNDTSNDNLLKYDEQHAQEISHLESRNIYIKQLEGQVIETAEIFQDLQRIVQDQQIPIDIIDENITKATNYVQSGEHELRGAERYQIKSRKRKCCITICLLFLAGIIILIIYVLTK